MGHFHLSSLLSIIVVVSFMNRRVLNILPKCVQGRFIFLSVVPLSMDSYRCRVSLSVADHTYSVLRHLLIKLLRCIVQSFLFFWYSLHGSGVNCTTEDSDQEGRSRSIHICAYFQFDSRDSIKIGHLSFHPNYLFSGP